MKPAAFAYHAPRTLSEATTLLAEAGAGGRVIAGGQSLVPMMNLRIAAPDVLVDLGGVAGLGAVAVDAEGGLVAGASVTMSRLLAAPESAGWPLLRAALRHVGHPQIRNRGTICGSLAHHDPTAELPAVAVALDAELTVVSSTGVSDGHTVVSNTGLLETSRRVVPAAEFFVSYYETVLAAGELVTAVRFPRRPPEGWGFSEFSRKHGDFALVGAAATVTAAPAEYGVGRGAGCSAVRLVLFGVGERPVRLPEVEAALVGRVIDEASLDAALAALPDLIDPLDDIRASERFRREVAAEMSRAALRQAWERAND
jgi:carbon-monoxide dehydrogenase medium subunit